ncbi:type II toxin-antitoxin system VapC family toxin [Sphingomonas adhaesiva]|uniref:type II toxin-antitoxin system VapC family toxin n=1 Tax=Sphingomonas adhaesiva TaxID=28212 RepID=UPI002FFC473D
MDLLIDTHVIVWIMEGSSRLSKLARLAVTDPGSRPIVSAMTAWEFADLRSRGRLPATASLATALAIFDIRILDLPAELWSLADGLPNLHGDPVDRMLIAHALHAGLTLVTADETIRRYPVPTLW